MDAFEAIRKERTSGKVLCGTTKAAKSVTTLAAAFGLKEDASLYHQVDGEMARAIIVGILHRDLAYGNRLLSLARAETLAGQIMQRYADPAIRFLTNGQFKQGAGAGLELSQWHLGRRRRLAAPARSAGVRLFLRCVRVSGGTGSRSADRRAGGPSRWPGRARAARSGRCGRGRGAGR